MPVEKTNRGSRREPPHAAHCRMLTVYEWRVLEKDRRGRDRWRTLRWRMGVDEAMHWSRCNGKTIDIVPGSAETRVSYQGDGVGQYLSPAPGKTRRDDERRVPE